MHDNVSLLILNTKSIITYTRIVKPTYVAQGTFESTLTSTRELVRMILARWTTQARIARTLINVYIDR